MKKIKLYSVLVLVVSLLTALLVGNSCGRQKPCKADIMVMDSAGVNPQAGVLVQLYATITTTGGGTTTADLKAEATTDANGKAYFTFKLPAIMDIKATKPACTPVVGVWSTGTPSVFTPGSYCIGKGIIKFEAGTTNSKTVYLRQ